MWMLLSIFLPHDAKDITLGMSRQGTKDAPLKVLPGFFSRQGFTENFRRMAKCSTRRVANGRHLIRRRDHVRNP